MTLIESGKGSIDIQDLRAMPYDGRKAEYFRGNHRLVIEIL